MSLRKRARARKAAVALSGLGLAANIIREATDDVGVVKEIFGCLARIIGYAEKIEKDRAALHELVRKAREMAQVVKDVLDGREPECKIAQSLEKIEMAFKAVETFMETLVAQGRIRRAISYAFTVPQHLERLTGEMSDAFQAFNLVALLDTTLRTQSIYRTIQDETKYDGQFHRIRDADVQKQDLFCQRASEERDVIVKYHRATVDGKVLVVRFFEEDGPPIPETDAVAAAGPTLIDRAISHDRILMEVSSVRKSHQHVASIYGWGSGNLRERFTVLKSGYVTVEDARKQGVVAGAVFFMRLAYKLMDAARHLEQSGITWLPYGPEAIFVDDNGEPTIGLTGELVDDEEHQSGYIDQLLILRAIYDEFVQWKHCQSFKGTVGLQDARIVQLLEREASVRASTLSLAKSGLLHQFLRSEETAGYLRKACSAGAESRFPDSVMPFGDLLLSLRPGDSSNKRLITSHYRLRADEEEDDQVEIVSLSEEEDSLHFTRLLLSIPNEERMGAREIFGVTAPPAAAGSEDNDRYFIFPITGL